MPSKCGFLLELWFDNIHILISPHEIYESQKIIQKPHFDGIPWIGESVNTWKNLKYRNMNYGITFSSFVLLYFS